jgi:protoheme IX farnesyltransferase
MTTSLETPARHAPAPSLRELLSTAMVLFKVRIVLLLLFAGAGGAFIAAGGWPGFTPLLMLTLTGGLAAMGASALNQYYEQDSDAAMKRTRRRPLVSGEVAHPRWIPAAALALILIPSLTMYPFNPPLAVWSLAGAVIYAGVYTVWLKPRTVLNIVLGGLAGTCAVLCGGAAVGQWAHPGVVTLGLLVFLWTPMHFWSLAIMYRDDYARVNIPMLPVRTSLRSSAGWVTLHAVGTGLAALALGALPTLGLLYTVPVALLTLDLLRRCVRLIQEPTSARARSLFLASNWYLIGVLLMICVAAVL